MTEYSMVKEVTIKFDERNTYNGIVIRGTYNNLPVYRHRDYENEILPGCTYICDLIINYSTMGNYFAIPLQKVEETKYQQSVIEEKKVVVEPVSGVMRISPTELKSDMFTEEGYQVKISPNGKRLSISPFSRSSNRCKNGVLTLTGLEKLVPFNGTRGYDFSLSGKTITISV